MAKVSVPVAIELTVPAVGQRPDGHFWGFARFEQDGDTAVWKAKGLWTLVARPVGPLVQAKPTGGETWFASAEAPSHLLQSGVRVEIWKPWFRIAVLTVE
jgi:hypothetical protein